MERIAFTLALNGMKFLPRQVTILPEVFDKWYIIEGPVNPTHCTAWCNIVPLKYLNDKNLSSDGTAEYLDFISQHPKIEVIRSPIEDGKHINWDGKVEMCNSFIHNHKNFIMMQIDMDEYWSKETLIRTMNYLEGLPHPNIEMLFKCNFFVGKNLVVIGENCYGDMPYEWTRAWKIADSTTWKSHEPPKLNMTPIVTVPKQVTSSMGLGFRHYAYYHEEQLRFKEDYYKYPGAVEGWKKLQTVSTFPVYLRDYFPWVKDNTMVTKI